MNRIRSAVAVTVALTAGAGVAATIAATGPASAGTSGQTPTGRSAGSFTVRVHHGSDASVDLGRRGFSAGDQDLFTGALTREGRRVGRLVGTCTTVRAGRTSADQLCEFVLRLGHAQLTATGSVSSGSQGPGTFDLAVVGGTGRFSAAAGQLAVTATSGRTFPITVTLS